METTAKRRSNGQFVKGNKEGVKFAKGNNANPNGRRGSLKDILDNIGDELDDKGMSNREAIMRKVVQMARRGDMKAIYFLADRSEGKALERVEQHITKDEIIIE